ncbi:hypothetical protein JHK84_044265 [Glycine max]|nr:hypothetical protein JHK86_044160 [Glycine max]KAG4950876.1 hypothetical protein JHK85_044743 [Glycine max]KAG5107358.1 hypothetical protein JHK84_044265 [Glycine max]
MEDCVNTLICADEFSFESFNRSFGALSVKLTPLEMAELESFAGVDAVKVSPTYFTPLANLPHSGCSVSQ